MPLNFAPMGAMALFGGVYLNRRYALGAALAAMVVVFLSALVAGEIREL